MASSFVRSKSLSSIRVPNPSPLVPSKFSSSFQISNFPNRSNPPKELQKMRSGSSETKFLQELVLYAASAALSCLVLFAGLRHLDSNRKASKKAIKHKDITKRFGRPLIQTNLVEEEAYEKAEEEASKDETKIQVEDGNR